MAGRKLVSSGTPFEKVAGYSRAIRVGNVIHVAGTTATDSDGNVLAKGNPVEQCRIIIGRIEKALIEAESSLSDVVRTRIYATRAKDCDSIMKVHGDFFKEIRPAATLVVVHELVNPEMLLEVEVEAIVQ
ncbi:MAG TPA: RidA family protein [Candidatus Thalassarchaeaceae archaeon]|jgi:enamine deaminase RidA (YjgF/YER057c/UK114 family)|nr:RidA family protein [Candidatus Thalassarchaeaceae archaeon]HJM87117.1 RidA family protein [Candidatus Thalassarchaeaceae archaeon]|tara:strand:- start:188 stop:577 length:390 start_codon:yes stop_codon:yes gene_type:complete